MLASFLLLSLFAVPGQDGRPRERCTFASEGVPEVRDALSAP